MREASVEKSRRIMRGKVRGKVRGKMRGKVRGEKRGRCEGMQFALLPGVEVREAPGNFACGLSLCPMRLIP